MISNSRNKLHQTTYKDIFSALYLLAFSKFCILASGLAGRERADDDGGVPVAVGHQLRGDDEHAQVRAQHQEHPQPARRQRGGRPQGPGHQGAPERDQDAQEQAQKLTTLNVGIIHLQFCIIGNTNSVLPLL